MILAETGLGFGPGEIGLTLSVVLGGFIGLIKHDASKALDRLDKAEQRIQELQTKSAALAATNQAERVAERVEKLEKAVSGIESNVAVIRAWVDQQANPEHRHRRFTDRDEEK